MPGLPQWSGMAQYRSLSLVRGLPLFTFLCGCKARNCLMVGLRESRILFGGHDKRLLGRQPLLLQLLRDGYELFAGIPGGRSLYLRRSQDSRSVCGALETRKGRHRFEGGKDGLQGAGIVPRMAGRDKLAELLPLGACHVALDRYAVQDSLPQALVSGGCLHGGILLLEGCDLLCAHFRLGHDQLCECADLSSELIDAGIRGGCRWGRRQCGNTRDSCDERAVFRRIFSPRGLESRI